MKSLLVFILGIFTFIVSIFMMLAKAFGPAGLRPGTRQWDDMVNKLRSKLNEQKAALIPWDGKDLLPLLSFMNLKDKSSWFEMGKTRVGTVDTIYQEPVLAVAEINFGKGMIAVARTTNTELVYSIKEKEVEIWVNSQPFAVLSGGALLSSGKNARLLAQIQSSNDERNIPVSLSNNTALTLNNPALPPLSPNPRALLLLRNLSQEEETAALALTVLYQLKNIK